MSLRKTAVTAILWSAAKSWGSRLVSFLVFLTLSRLLQPEAFGLITMAMLYIAFMQPFIEQGFGAAIVQKSELEPEHLDTAFWTNLFIGSLLTLGSVVASNSVALLFHEPQLAEVIRWLSLNFLILPFSSIQQALLQRKLDFKSIAVCSLYAYIIGGVIGLVMAFYGLGVWSLVAQNLTINCVSMALFWKISDWRPGFKFHLKHFRELFSFGINISGGRVIDFFNRRADDLLIGYYLGATALGYYTIAYRLLLIMTELLTSVTNSVAFPVFSRLQEEPERMRRAFYKVTQYTSLIAFPIFFGMLVLAPEIIISLFGSKWSNSIKVMQVLSIIGILHSVSYFNGTALKAFGKPSWRLKIMLVNAIFNIIVFSFVIHWGILAIAVAYVIVAYLIAPIEILAVKKLIKINILTYIRQFLEPLIASLLMVSTILFLKHIVGQELQLYIKLVVYIFAGGCSYLLVMGLIAKALMQQVFNTVYSLLYPSRAN